MSTITSTAQQALDARVERLRVEINQVLTTGVVALTFTNRISIILEHINTIKLNTFSIQQPTTETYPDLAMMVQGMICALNAFYQQIRNEQSRVNKLEEEELALPVRRLLERLERGEREVDVSYVQQVKRWVKVAKQVPHAREDEANVLNKINEYYHLCIHNPLQTHRYANCLRVNIGDVERDLGGLKAVLDEICNALVRLNDHVTTLHDDTGKAVESLRGATRETKQFYMELKQLHDNTGMDEEDHERLYQKSLRDDAARAAAAGNWSEARVPLRFIDDDGVVHTAPTLSAPASGFLSPVQEASEPADEVVEPLTLVESMPLPVLTSREEDLRGCARGSLRKNTI